MTKILLGNTKCGWSVDDENKEIIIYHPQSLVDKMKKKIKYHSNKISRYRIYRSRLE